MRVKLTASLAVLVVFATGAIPAFAGYRCLAMGTRMQSQPACCDHETDATAIKAPCCESLAAARIEPRRTQPSPETKIQPPTVIAWVAYPSPTPLLGSVESDTAARARGRPPGERLHLLGTVLRV